ncbi:hypothetical protein [Streptomyces sp. ME19-01-6]|uniref:hypothetical protein n=1 Tax=Streptomyces sp. ME19-01-6 TaxID=3028686 RepID=UPI0029BF57E1|nr:hypothetical protein [Streptomyces sp. ME19-01-6]MDX3224485.1 hypothetical protein [Streptomyces sp. ME19-01-6]
MDSEQVVRQWEAAQAKAKEFRGLSWNERDCLGLIYYLICANDQSEASDVSLRAVRYRLCDLQQLRQDLSELLPGPRTNESWSVQKGLADLARTRLSEVEEDYGDFTGPPPVAGTIWRLWNSLQAPHGELLEDSLPAEMVHEGVYGRYRPTGTTVFEHAARRLAWHIDMLLLPASGAPRLGSRLEVTGGAHTGRTGNVNAVTWGTDDEERICTETPVSFQVRFDDDTGLLADVPSADVETLPTWDNQFVIVYAGERFPSEWRAAVLLTASGSTTTWHDEAVQRLQQGWRDAGRLVVLIPELRDGTPLSIEQTQWVEKAVTWADEILTMAPAQTDPPVVLTPSAPANARDQDGRVIVINPEANAAVGTTAAGAQLQGISAVPTVAAAVGAALTRIGIGHARTGGQREVPLLVADSPAFYEWSRDLRAAGKSLVGARVEWAHGEDTRGRAMWWALRPRIRHADQKITEEFVVAHTSLVSIVAYFPQNPWTDTEVILVPTGTNHSARTGLSYQTKQRSLRLPTAVSATIDNDRARSRAALSSELGVPVDTDRLRSFDARSDTSLLETSHGLAHMELTEEEIDEARTRARTGPAGSPEVHRVADLLADPVCDWATLGLITRAVLPTWPPRSGDFTPDRHE